MNTCGTCKHWSGHDEKVEGYGVWKHFPCGRVKHDDGSSATPLTLTLGAHLYSEETLEVERKYMDGLDDAVVQDGSGYFAALKTRKSFGCIFHKFEENSEHSTN